MFPHFPAEDTAAAKKNPSDKPGHLVYSDRPGAAQMGEKLMLVLSMGQGAFVELLQMSILGLYRSQKALRRSILLFLS